MNFFKKSNRKKIRILFKSGNSITLTVDSLSVKKSNIDNRIMMYIIYPETIGMDEDERKIAIDGIKKRKFRKEKLDNLLNEKRQN